MSIIRKPKICKSCGQSRNLWARGLCLTCDRKKNPQKHKMKPKVSKPTGELVIMKVIFEDSNKKCWVCDEPIKIFSPGNMMHILPKSTYPEFRLLKKNIKPACFPYGNQCHHKWDFTSQEDLKKDPMWDKVFELKERLQNEYYDNKQKV